MTQYATLNPLGSTSPYDLFDNAQNFDFAINSTSLAIWKDRFGKGRLSWYGLEALAIQAMRNYGYITAKSFELGYTLTTPNTVLQLESTGEYYRWDGDWTSSKIVPHGSTPETTGGIGTGAWVSVGDAALRSQISNPDGATLYPELQVARWRDDRDVRGWGAKGDGITDDTSAFQSAPKNSVVSQGTYLVDTQIVDVSQMTGEGFILSKTGHLLTLTNNINGNLVHRHLMEAEMGFGEDQAFPNAEATSQGMAYANYNGKKLYLLQTVVGGADGSGNFNASTTLAGSFTAGLEYEIATIGTTDFTAIGASTNTIGVRFTATGVGSGSGSAALLEKRRLVEYTFTDDGSKVAHSVLTDDFLNNHQGISAMVYGSELLIYTQMVTQPNHRGVDGGKGFSTILWKGATTGAADISTYQLFGYTNSGHRFQNFWGATPCVSSDGRYIALLATDSIADDDRWMMFIYDRAQVESLSDPLNANPLYTYRVPHPERGTDTHVIQDIASDGKYVYVLRGYTHPFMQHIIQKFDFEGNLHAEFNFDGARGLYGSSGLLNNPTYGTPHSFEPEGIDMYEGDLVVLVMDNWDSGASIVTYKGKNYSAFSTATGIAPDDADGFRVWAATNKASGGSYSSTATYSDGDYSKRGKQVILISQSKSNANEYALSAGLVTRLPNSPLNSISNARDISFKQGEDWLVCPYSENTGLYTNGLAYMSNGAFRAFDPRNVSDNSKYWSIRGGYDLTPTVQEVVEFRCRGSVAGGAGWNAYGANDAALPNRFRIYSGGSYSGVQVLLELVNPSGSNPYLAPTGQIGTVNNGTATAYWNNIFSKNAVTVVSDRNLKDKIQDIPEALIDAVGSVKLQMWKLRDSIAEKGLEKARYHFGVVAQQVRDAITDAGLDWTQYGLITYEENKVEVIKSLDGNYYPKSIESSTIPVNESGYIDLIEGADILTEDDGAIILIRAIYMMRMDEFEIIRMAYHEKRLYALERN